MLHTEDVPDGYGEFLGSMTDGYSQHVQCQLLEIDFHPNSIVVSDTQIYKRFIVNEKL